MTPPLTLAQARQWLYDKRERGDLTLSDYAALDQHLEELAALLAVSQEPDHDRLLSAIRWALGEEGEFPEEPPPLAGKYRRQYYWRSELRRRAGLTAVPQEPEAQERTYLTDDEWRARGCPVGLRYQEEVEYLNSRKRSAPSPISAEALHERSLKFEAERAALSTAPAPPQGWQPIVTAPKDGTEVLLLSQTGNREVGSYSEWPACWQVHAMPWEPTHWMPLPPPPEASR